jgi:hypothetical protein
VARTSARRGQTVAWPLRWRTDAGARVFSYDDKRSEIGYYPIEPTAGLISQTKPMVTARMQLAFSSTRK